MLKPGRIGGQGGGAAEVLGIRMLDHTAFDVTALHGRVLDAVFCLVHCFHDATRTGDGTRGSRGNHGWRQSNWPAGGWYPRRNQAGVLGQCHVPCTRAARLGLPGHRDDVTGMMPVKRVRHRGGRVDRSAVDRGDHVAGGDAETCRRSAPDHALDSCAVAVVVDNTQAEEGGRPDMNGG